MHVLIWILLFIQLFFLFHLNIIFLSYHIIYLLQILLSVFSGNRLYLLVINYLMVV